MLRFNITYQFDNTLWPGGFDSFVVLNLSNIWPELFYRRGLL